MRKVPMLEARLGSCRRVWMDARQRERECSDKGNGLKSLLRV